MLVLSSASGYPLGEHGQIGWRVPNVYEEAVHAPLMIRFPGRRYAGTRIWELTQSADLDVALSDWAGNVESATGLDGLIRGTIETLRPHAISTSEVAGQSARALRTADWAFIQIGEKRELYRKPEDRWEVNNVAENKTDTVEELEAILNPPE